MSRRVSSRDDIFLSALDLFSVLLFACLGLAFLVNHGLQGESEIPLPVLPTSGAGATQDRNTLFVEWSSGVDVEGADGHYCKVTLREGALTARSETASVPCWPGAFGSGQRLALSARLQTASDRAMRAVVVCPRNSSSVESCGRLVFVVAEHGLPTSIAAGGVQ